MYMLFYTQQVTVAQKLVTALVLAIILVIPWFGFGLIQSGNVLAELVP